MCVSARACARSHTWQIIPRLYSSFTFDFCGRWECGSVTGWIESCCMVHVRQDIYKRIYLVAHITFEAHRYIPHPFWQPSCSNTDEGRRVWYELEWALSLCDCWDSMMLQEALYLVLAGLSLCSHACSGFMLAFSTWSAWCAMHREGSITLIPPGVGTCSLGLVRRTRLWI